MGNTYDFKCPACEFQVTCSQGVDRGFTIEVLPMFCSKCKIVKNIHIGNYAYDKSGDIKFKSVDKVCKKCETGEYLQEWDCHTCVNCGKVGILYRNSGVVWD